MRARHEKNIEFDKTKFRSLRETPIPSKRYKRKTKPPKRKPKDEMFSIGAYKGLRNPRSSEQLRNLIKLSSLLEQNRYLMNRPPERKYNFYLPPAPPRVPDLARMMRDKELIEKAPLPGELTEEEKKAQELKEQDNLVKDTIQPIPSGMAGIHPQVFNQIQQLEEQNKELKDEIKETKEQMQEQPEKPELQISPPEDQQVSGIIMPGKPVPDIRTPTPPVPTPEFQQMELMGPEEMDRQPTQFRQFKVWPKEDVEMSGMRSKSVAPGPPQRQQTPERAFTVPPPVRIPRDYPEDTSMQDLAPSQFQEEKEDTPLPPLPGIPDPNKGILAPGEGLKDAPSVVGQDVGKQLEKEQKEQKEKIDKAIEQEKKIQEVEDIEMLDLPKQQKDLYSKLGEFNRLMNESQLNVANDEYTKTLINEIRNFVNKHPSYKNDTRVQRILKMATRLEKQHVQKRTKDLLNKLIKHPIPLSTPSRLEQFQPLQPVQPIQPLAPPPKPEEKRDEDEEKAQTISEEKLQQEEKTQGGPQDVDVPMAPTREQLVQELPPLEPPKPIEIKPEEKKEEKIDLEEKEREMNQQQYERVVGYLERDKMPVLERRPVVKKEPIEINNEYILPKDRQLNENYIEAMNNMYNNIDTLKEVTDPDVQEEIEKVIRASTDYKSSRTEVTNEESKIVYKAFKKFLTDYQKTRELFRDKVMDEQDDALRENIKDINTMVKTSTFESIDVLDNLESLPVMFELFDFKLPYLDMEKFLKLNKKFHNDVITGHSMYMKNLNMPHNMNIIMRGVNKTITDYLNDNAARSKASPSLKLINYIFNSKYALGAIAYNELQKLDKPINNNSLTLRKQVEITPPEIREQILDDKLMARVGSLKQQQQKQRRQQLKREQEEKEKEKIITLQMKQEFAKEFKKQQEREKREREKLKKEFSEEFKKQEDIKMKQPKQEVKPKVKPEVKIKSDIKMKEPKIKKKQPKKEKEKEDVEMKEPPTVKMPEQSQHIEQQLSPRMPRLESEKQIEEDKRKRRTRPSKRKLKEVGKSRKEKQQELEEVHWKRRKNPVVVNSSSLQTILDEQLEPVKKFKNDTGVIVGNVLFNKNFKASNQFTNKTTKKSIVNQLVQMGGDEFTKNDANRVYKSKLFDNTKDKNKIMRQWENYLKFPGKYKVDVFYFMAKSILRMAQNQMEKEMPNWRNLKPKEETTFTRNRRKIIKELATDKRVIRLLFLAKLRRKEAFYKGKLIVPKE